MTLHEKIRPPHGETRESTVVAYGTGCNFTFTRAETSGALLRVEAGGTIYFSADRNGWITLGAGLGRYRDRCSDTEQTRHFETPHGAWTEHYRFCEEGRLVHVDGVDILRNENGQVTACLGERGDPELADHRWFYTYTGDGLVSIDAPSGVRHLSHAADGRVVALRDGGTTTRIGYNALGFRRDVRVLSSETHHRDKAGRIWSVTNDAGDVLATYIWDGWRCIGRIDGPPGAPLAAAFSLDPSSTPVRVVLRDGVIRIPRDAFGEGLGEYPGVPGLYGAFQHNGMHHLPWRVLDPRVGSFTSPDPFDGSENDPRRGPDARYEGDLDIETDRQRAYDICRGDPVGRADPSGGISAGLLISSLTWSFQNNILTFFGLDWWINLFGSLFTGSDFFSSDGINSSPHIGAFGIRRGGVIATDRAFTTQHLVWAKAESFDELNDGMVIDPGGSFIPDLLGGYLHAAPAGLPAFLLQADASTGGALGWNRNGGVAAPAFPGASQPVFPSGGFHFTGQPIPQRGPVACPLTELVPGPAFTSATIDDPSVGIQRLRVGSTTTGITTGEPIALQDTDGDVFISTVATVDARDSRTDITVADDVPTDINPAGLSVTRLNPTNTSETVQDPGSGVQGFSARGLSESYPASDVLEIRSEAGGEDVTFCRTAGAEARIPLNAPAPAAMTPPITVLSTTLAPPVTVKVDGTDGLDFTGVASVPAGGIIGVASNGTDHVPLRITNATASPVLRTDGDMTVLGPAGTEVEFRLITLGAPLGSRTDAVETDAFITYTPTTPDTAPDGSAGLQVVVLSTAGATPDAPRVVTGAPIYDAILTTEPINAGAAPWRVTKWTALAGTAAIPGFNMTSAIAITPDAPDVLGAGTLAVRVLNFAAASGVPTGSATALIPGIAMADTVATHRDLASNMPAAPRVTDFVILDPGAGDTVAAIARMELEFEFDRDVVIDPATPSYVVRLRPAGFAWTATRGGTKEITLSPMVSGTRGQFPRIRPNSLMRVDWVDGTTRTVLLYRVSAVDGLTLTLEGPTDIPADTATSTLTAQLLEADDPGTGHERIAINLSPVAGTTRAGKADVWSPDAFAFPSTGPSATGDNGFAIITSGTATPVNILTNQQELTITFVGSTGVAGSADLHGLTVAERFDRADFTMVDGDLHIEGTTSSLGAFYIQPYVAGPGPAAAGATLHPGSVITPTVEDQEVTRRQALVDHELVHTEQYHKFGPIWFCYFPLFLLELPVELATDLDLPEYGPSVGGTLALAGARVVLTPESSLDVNDGDEVQIIQGGEATRMTVSSLSDDDLIMRGTTTFREGAVQLRKVNNNGQWSETIISILRVVTHGGLLNLGAGFTWGGLLWLLSKGIYGIARAIGGAGDQYPGEVGPSGSVIELSSDEGQRELNADGQFIIKSGDISVVRTATRAGTQLLLDQPVELTGTVQVSAYSNHDPGSHFDWLSYHPGTVVADNAAAIDLPGRGSGFSPGDRIEYIYRDQGQRTFITRVTGDQIEVEDVVPITGTERSIRVALLSEAADTLGNVDEAALHWMGMGWMRILYDPYGQIEARVETTETWQDVLLRVMRVILGTRNFSLLPLGGYVFMARLIPFPFTPPEHRATIEQDASEKSGDLYTQLSRLNGQVLRDDRYDSPRMAVGDIARFRHWPWGLRTLSTIGATATGQTMAAPGLHERTRNFLRVIIDRQTGAPTFIPNLDVASDPTTNPGLALPDALYTKNFNANLGNLAAPLNGGTPVVNDSMAPADLGVIPVSPTTVRNPSAYLAFTRAGNHRATVSNNGQASIAAGLTANDNLSQALDAQQNNRQNLWFNITARDVTVTVNGTDVSEGQTVTLVQTETARITVTMPADVPSVPRVHRATVANPSGSAVLRSEGPLRLVAQGSNSTTPEFVEVSRFYDFNEDTGTFVDSVVADFGMHLGRDLDIPVRGFDVVVIDTLTLRDAAAPDATEITSLVQGEDAFVIIPTTPAEVDSYRLGAAASTGSDPALTFDAATVTPEVQAAIGTLGQARRISFAADPPLSATTPVEIEIPVTGEGGASGTLRLAFDLEPPSP